MPWKECSMDSERRRFIQIAIEPGVNISQLCREFNISRSTGYKWLARFREGGAEALRERSRRPHHSPNRTESDMESIILGVRRKHPDWGGRKIQKYLKTKGESGLPAPSTITEIIRRHVGIDPQESEKHRGYQRFEKPAPNILWQMDFKGDFATGNGRRCFPLTVLDDHSRYLLGLRACVDQKGTPVQEHLTDIFRHYGLPESMVMDNGKPWSGGCPRCFTRFSAWLLRLDIEVIFSRPRHPQTLGKDERLHRTLNTELIKRHHWLNIAECQLDFDRWRHLYNNERPHEALQMDSPADRYYPSPRPFPEELPPVTFGSTQTVRKVDKSGKIYLYSKRLYVGKAFMGEYVEVRETETDGVYDVYFCKHWIRKVDIRVDQC